MSRKPSFVLSPEVLIYPMLFGLLIWVVYWVEIEYGYDFSDFGVYPRTLKGLRGVLLSPFIHSTLKHLYNNTIPLMLLTAALFYFYAEVKWKVLIYGMLISGVITWLFARSAYHIGASGIIYMLSSFIFFRGIFTRYFRLIAVSMIIVFLYGSLVWYLFPIDKSISWEGHLSGFVVGLVFAFFFKEKRNRKEFYPWEKEDYNEEDDPFLKHFDENGNFIPSSELYKEEEDS